MSVKIAPPHRHRTHRTSPATPPWDELDPGIVREVRVLWENGIETTEACEGGQGHPFPEPTVRFWGGPAQGFRALAVARENGLRVSALRRYWSIEDGEPVGPHWEMTFVHEGRGCVPVEKNDGTGTVTWKWI